jgi:hypothetical protein
MLAALLAALTFYAPFDGTLDAARALGNPKLMTAASLARRAEATAGLPTGGETIHAKGEGKFGDALKMTIRRKPVVYFEAARNVAYSASNWSGTVSFWLSVDPATQLDPGFCDPIQITPRQWDDAAFFVEFEKKPDAIPFRLGAFPDRAIWNTTTTPSAQTPMEMRPLITVDRPPFGAGKWTHVVFTFDKFNTGQANAVTKLYLDGKPAGQLAPRQQTFTWDPERSTIAMGLSYVGLFDELSVFSRALTDTEVAALYGLPTGVTGLLGSR